MSILYQLLEFLRTLLNWWFVVEPWEQAIRVRFGKHVKLFDAGVHVKMPFFDKLYVQNVRRRVSSIPLQTMTTADGKTMTMHGSIGYRIADVLKLHSTLHDAEVSVQQEVLGHITQYIVTNEKTACTPEKIVAYVKAKQNLQRYGLADVDFFLQGYVSDVPTYRLIQDSMSQYQAVSGLNTGVSSALPKIGY